MQNLLHMHYRLEYISDSSVTVHNLLCACMQLCRALSMRAQRLSEVRQMFIVTYKAAVPDITEPPPGGNPLAGITGFFSRLLSPNTTV